MSFKIFLIGLFVVFSLSVAEAATIARDVNRANVLYGEGKYEEASGLYENVLKRDPNLPEANYNLGTALYKKGDYNASIERFQKSLLTEDPSIQQKARYNLANALYKQGLGKESSNLSGAIEDLKSAISHYEKNLVVLLKDPDAQHNLDFVNKELERLKAKQIEQQQKQQQQQQQNSPEQSKQENQENKDPGGQNQDQNSSGNKKNEDTPRDPQKQQPESGGQENNSPQENKGEEDQNQNGNAPKDKPQEQGQQPQQNPGNSQSGSQPQGQSPSGAQANGDGQMTPQEAQMMLDDYQRNDEPKGMLYFKPESGRSDEVIKDW